MPETETQGVGYGTLEAVVIRADGTVEDKGFIATPDGVGEFRFCPACRRRELSESPENAGWFQPWAASRGLGEEDYEDWRCSGCARPWIACPCRPLKSEEED